MNQDQRAAFITLEGIDGAGKTTHLDAITDWIQARGHPLVKTREPGGTPIGEQLRALVLAQPMSAGTEALLMFAARHEHIVQVIAPALAAGHWVVSDRFSDASIAYQGGGRGLGVDRVAELERWTHPELRPDLTLLFDIDPELAAQRVAKGRSQRDRFETEQVGFFARVRAAYLARAAAEATRFCVLDASASVTEVWLRIETALARLAAGLVAQGQGR
jgi:dTMP kinase